MGGASSTAVCAHHSLVRGHHIHGHSSFIHGGLSLSVGGVGCHCLWVLSFVGAGSCLWVLCGCYLWVMELICMCYMSLVSGGADI